MRRVLVFRNYSLNYIFPNKAEVTKFYTVVEHGWNGLNISTAL